jgi:SRSO17 transposase
MATLLFKTKTDDGFDHASRYLEGLVTTTARKNIERMNERLPDGDYEGMQHFLSTSPWDERGVYDHIAKQADLRLGGQTDSMLLIDESGFSKKGKASVGVARQYNGRLGKQDNCQVGVYSVLSCGVRHALIGTRLFLPDEWTKDADRSEKAGVPEEEIKARSKIDLARELVTQAMEQQVRFACIGMDAFYGRDQTFLQWLDEQHLTYCADVPANALVFCEKPKSKKRPKKMSEEAQRVDQVAKEWSAKKGKQISLREGENGLVRVRVWAKRVWTWPASQEAPEECWMIVRRMQDGKLKISLSNAAAKTTLKQLASWQGGRYFVERAFQDAKSHAGMGQYQVRGWRAWHHHMALVSLAMLFILEERLLQRKTAPLLSAGDIVEILDWYLTKPRTEREILETVRRRHRQRERNALNAQNRRRARIGLPEIEKMAENKLPK